MNVHEASGNRLMRCLVAPIIVLLGTAMASPLAFG